MKFIYNDNDINSMSYGSLHVNKIYYNGYVYQYAGIPDSGGQHPCFDVTDNISTYSVTEYDMVYDTTQEKWYMLNNLSEYEEYGIMGSGRNITTYEGKLTIDGEYEYRWDGTQWVSVGEVTGGTASLPDIPFTCNYNARDYNPSTHTIPKTTGQLNGVDAVITGDTAHITDHHEDGYITFAISGNGTRAIVSGTSSDYWNRTNSTPELTIICKAKTTGNSGNIIVNRSSTYNWMFRQYSNKLTLHGTSETGSIAITTGVVTTCGVRVSSDRSFVYNNFTNDTTSSGVNFSYGNTTTGGGCLFMGYSTTNSEQWNGDFYWVYFSQNTLTDAQVQQVIDFNDGGGITIPLDYEDLDAPVDNVVFSTMADALAYECPWIGMTATIAGEDYIFGDTDEWLEKYGLFEVTGQYLCSSGNKYKKMEEKVRNVDGTWSSQSPAVYEIGDLIERDSEDCSSRVPSGYVELTYAQTPKMSINSSVYFSVPIDLQATNKYIFEFTPLNWEESYYGSIVGGHDGYQPFSWWGLYKIDNGWGDMTKRFISSFWNYKLDSRNPSPGGNYRVYTDVKARFTMNLHNYTVGEGADIMVENEGYETVRHTSTTVYSSSYTVTPGVYNLELFSRSGGSGVYMAAIKFHDLKVETNTGDVVYEYVPCKRLSDGKVGLYDIVHNNFYAPTGFTLLEGGEVNGGGVIDYTKKYLTFVPTSGNCTFTHDRTAVQYSLNSGTTWQTLATNGSVTVQQGQEIWWKANFTQGNNDLGNGTFTATNYFKAEGNLLSLIGGDDFESVTTIGNAIFGALFMNCTYLNDIDNLKIPASSYGNFAFRQTFRNSGIVTMPTDLLTASTIGNYCFYGGFEACANLVKTCEFNFTSVGSNGCGYMFQGCSNLSTVIDLSTTTANRSSWLNAVASTGTFLKRSGVSWGSGGGGIPNGWTTLEYIV